MDKKVLEEINLSETEFVCTLENIRHIYCCVSFLQRIQAKAR